MSELQRPIQIGGRWYVLATSAPAEEQPQALKRDELFALFDRYGDIVPWEGGDQGLYLQDTRYLSHLELLLERCRRDRCPGRRPGRTPAAPVRHIRSARQRQTHRARP